MKQEKERVDKVTKADIVQIIYDKMFWSNISRQDVQSVIDLFFNEVKDSLIKDKVIEFRGFGTFEVRTRKGRAKARNPRTGEYLSIPDHGVVNFRSGKDLKNDIWSIRS